MAKKKRRKKKKATRKKKKTTRRKKTKRKTTRRKKTTRKKTKRKSKKKVKRKAKKSTKKRAKKRKKKKTPRKGTGQTGFMAPVTPSTVLAEVVGKMAQPRTKIVKKIWAYIKKKRLQNPKNRRMIILDDCLKKVFKGKHSVNMFEMNKLLKKHMKA